jgi:LysR substrate binding domain
MISLQHVLHIASQEPAGWRNKAIGHDSTCEWQCRTKGAQRNNAFFAVRAARRGECRGRLQPPSSAVSPQRGKAFLLAFGAQAVALSDLADEPFILPEGCPGMQDLINVLASRGIAVRVAYKTDRDDMALALVASGIGLALVPGKFEVASVKQVPIIDLGIYREVGLIWQRERKRDALKEFIDFAANHCWGLEERPSSVTLEGPNTTEIEKRSGGSTIDT